MVCRGRIGLVVSPGGRGRVVARLGWHGQVVLADLETRFDDTHRLVEDGRPVDEVSHRLAGRHLVHHR